MLAKAKIGVKMGRISKLIIISIGRKSVRAVEENLIFHSFGQGAFQTCSKKEIPAVKRYVKG